VSQIDWPSVREAYLGSDLTISEICTKFELVHSVLYRRIRTEGWPLRSATMPEAGRPGPPGDAGPRDDVPGEDEPHSDTPGEFSGEPAARTERLVARLFNALERQMHEIEHRLNGDSQRRDAAARERDARTLASLVRTLEKLCALHAGPAGSGSPEANELEPEAVARMRQAIARRIARIMPEGTD
jgi:hypothetical protein